MPDKTRELFSELINYLEKNVEKKYWPTQNPDYDQTKEIRKDTYRNLYRIYKSGGDILSGN